MSLPRRITRPTTALALATALGFSALGVGPVDAAPAAQSPGAAAPAPQKVRLVTTNVTFKGARETQEHHRKRVARKWALVRDRADIVFFQETRDITLKSIIDTRRWVVRQNTASKATRGTAVVVRRSAVRSVGRLRLVTGVRGSSCPGGGIGTRYVARTDVVLDNGRTLKVASAHLPPKRCWGAVYNTMANRIVSMARATDGRLVFGADWNKIVANDPNDLSGRTGMKRRGHKIDGFYLRPRTTTIGTLRTLSDAKDHPPVQLTLTVR